MKNKLKIHLRIILESLFGKRPEDFKKIPIIINNFNRLTTLKILIQDLEIRGYHNIHIIDNKSDYQPLLDFYKDTNYIVYRLKKT